MATIKSGLNLIVYNGETKQLESVSWLAYINSINQINPARAGWISFVPNELFNAVTEIAVNNFYFIDAKSDFNLPDAQTVACATGEASADIPAGYSLFVFAGADYDLSSPPAELTDLYTVNSNRLGWLGWKPGEPFNAFESLQSGVFYFAISTGPFVLPGAQTVACAETYGSENIDGSKYVKYPDLLGEIPEVANPKTAPNMPLFKAKIEALEAPHNHDDRYYIKSETYSQAQINAIFQGVDEVIDLPTFGDFPQPGQTSKLYIDEQYNVGYRWSAVTGYIAVSSPGIDLTPYLTKTEAANVYQVKGDYLTIAAANNLYPLKTDVWTKPEADNRYQFKGNFAPAGNYVKSISVNGGAYNYPDLAGHINLLFQANFEQYLKTRPDYVANVVQRLGHDANAVIRWFNLDGTTPPPVVVTGNRYVKTGYTNKNYVK